MLTMDQATFIFGIILTNQKDISSTNLNTGDIKYFNSKASIKLPNNKRVRNSRLVLDYAGLYRDGGDEFVASLNDAKESDVNGESIITKTLLVQASEFEEKKKEDLSQWFILICLLLVLLELILIKVRGDV